MIENNRPWVQYTAEAAETVFAVPFELNAATDLKVYVNGALVTTGFSLTGVGVDEGATLTFDAGLEAGDIVTLTRVTPPTRASDFDDSVGPRATGLNSEGDRAVALAQEAVETALHALHRAAYDTDVDLTLPSVAERAGMLLAFDDGGLPVAVDSLGTIQNPSPDNIDIGLDTLTEVAADFEARIAALELGVPAVPDASTTVKGIVELATNAETITGTDAARAVTPAALQAKIDTLAIVQEIYVLAQNGDDAAVTGDTNEHDLYSITVPGNSLGEDGSVVMDVLADVSRGGGGGSQTITFRLKYGGTTLATLAVSPASSVNSPIRLRGVVTARGATNSQYGQMEIGNYSVNPVLSGARGTAAVDSTADKTLVVTVQSNHADHSVTKRHGQVTLSKAT